MVKKNVQEIYINLDDSGKLTSKEWISVYGGLVFLSKREKDKFITQYRSIVNEIKCSYCKHRENCNKKCPEIKNTNIKPKHKRRIMNYLHKYYIVALVIKNEEVYDYIKNNKAAKGRFLDYSMRRMIKEIIKRLISLKMVDSNKDIRLILNIDQQSTKNNGYYNLKDGLLEELKYGITSFNYAATFLPIIFGKLEIKLMYQASDKCYVVQAADLLAGTIRCQTLLDFSSNEVIEENLKQLVDFEIILP